jgi:hypothetical protein
MRISGFEPTIRRGAAALAVLAAASMATGCSTNRLFGSEPAATASASASAPAAPSSPSTMSQVKDMFLRKQPEPTQAEKEASNRSMAEGVCPTVDIRAGASTLMIPQANADPLALRYQGSIGELARECNVSSGIMRIKVGVEGRILVGPAGSPGQVEVPLRYAVVKEGPEPKTVVSKFIKFPVTVPDGQSNVLFSHVDSDIAFPMPSGLDIEAYVVYVGFDPIGDKPAPAAKKPKAGAAPRR